MGPGSTEDRSVEVNRYRILVRHEIRRALKSIVPRAVFVVMPLGLVAFLRRTFSLALTLTGRFGADGSEQAVPGMAILFSFVVLVYFGYTAFDDFGFGMWDRLRVNGVRSLDTLAAKATVMFGHLVIHLTVVVVVGVVVFRLDIEGPLWGLVVIAACFALMCTAYAFLGFALATSNAIYNAWCYVGALSLTALGGGLVPFEVLPGWARSIAPATPAYWALQGARSVLEGTASGADIFRHGLALIGFGLLFLLIGIWRFDPSADREAFAL